MAMSFGRLSDRIIIAAALGTAFTGSNMQGRVALPNSQKYVAGTGNTAGKFGLRALKDVRTHFKKRAFIQQGSKIVFVISADESAQLLDEREPTNRDFTNILTLMEGEISYFYGFVFIETQLLPANHEEVKFNYLADPNAGGVTNAQRAVNRFANSAGTGTVGVTTGRRCFAFMSGTALCFGINQSTNARVSERPDLHYDIQIYYSSELGATRKEEVQVMEILTEYIA